MVDDQTAESQEVMSERILSLFVVEIEIKCWQKDKRESLSDRRKGPGDGGKSVIADKVNRRDNFTGYTALLFGIAFLVLHNILAQL